MNESFSQNKWKYSTIGLLAVLAVGFSFPEVFAAASLDSVLSVVRNIQALLNDQTFGLQAIKNAIGNGASQTSVNTLQTDVTALKASQYVPFSVITSNSEPFVCVSNGTQNDHDHINISSGADIIVNGVIIEPDNVINPDDVVASGFLTVNGHQIFISTHGLSPTNDTPSNDAFDIMTSTATYPHQVAGSTIDFELVCQHDTDNDSINFEKIVVSGWKRAGASVSVSYQE